MRLHSLLHGEVREFIQHWCRVSIPNFKPSRIAAERPYLDKRDECGPFDIIGDVHGCLEELKALLLELGYRPAQVRSEWTHPKGRKLIFAGDLSDRGPDTPGVIKMAMKIVRYGLGYAVMGNHDEKLLRYLLGNPVKVSGGLQKSIEQYEALCEYDRLQAQSLAKSFLEKLPPHIVFDGGGLVVAHAGLSAEFHGVDAPAAVHFALYGPVTTGEGPDGRPAARDWASDYNGEAIVAQGHVPVDDVTAVNNVWMLDTGCAFGGKLSALRYPELEVVSVPAAEVYWPRKGALAA